MSASGESLHAQLPVGERRLKILVYGINFAPEPVGVGRYTGEMAAYLQAAGHEVRVITALPYYPEWRVASHYKVRQYVTEVWQGIRVSRAPLWVPARPGGRKRVLHLVSFAVTSLPLLARSIFWRPDIVWMAAPALVCAPAALLTAKLSGAKSWIHVQDFEIDIGFGMGMISGGKWKRLACGIERFLLTRFDRVSTISKAMVQRALDKGVQAARLSLVPNWVDVEAIVPLREPSPYRRELNIPDDAVVALYSGSMGLKQGVDLAAQAAVRLADVPDLYFVFCGEGALKDGVVKACEGLPRVRFLPLQPAERLNALLGMADIHMLPQRPGAADMVMPSKLTGMLASGRPVVAMASAGGELAQVARQCGEAVPHEDVEAFGCAIHRLALQRLLREDLGRHARAYADQHLSSKAVIGQLNEQMQSIAAGTGAALVRQT